MLTQTFDNSFVARISNHTKNLKITFYEKKMRNHVWFSVPRTKIYTMYCALVIHGITKFQ